MKLTFCKFIGLKLICLFVFLGVGGNLYADNPTNVTLWCLNYHNVGYGQIFDTHYTNYDFVHQRYHEYNHQEEHFDLLKGDRNTRGNGTISAREEMYQASWRPNSNVWHHYEAYISVTSWDPNGDYCLVQIFNDLASHPAPDLQIRFKNGKLSTSDHGASGGPVTLAVGLTNGAPFLLKIESNGYLQNVYVNGVKKYSHVPYTTDPASRLNWRWGIYSNDTISNYVHTVVNFTNVLD